MWMDYMIMDMDMNVEMDVSMDMNMHVSKHMCMRTSAFRLCMPWRACTRVHTHVHVACM